MSERRMAVSIAAKVARVDGTGPVLCRVCGNRNDRARRYCARCASPLAESTADRPVEAGPVVAADPEPVTCATCGHPVGRDEVFCPSCGRYLAFGSPNKPPDRLVPHEFDPNIMYSVATPQAPPTPPIRPSLRRTLTTLIAYVPTSTIAVFLPAWSALLLFEAGGATLGQPAKLAIAFATGLVAGLAVWRGGYRRGRSDARRSGHPEARVSPQRVLRIGAWEVTAATLAAFAWATAAPSSWAGFSSAIWPLATVTLTTIGIALVAAFASPLEGDA